MILSIIFAFVTLCCFATIWRMFNNEPLKVEKRRHLGLRAGESYEGIAILKGTTAPGILIGLIVAAITFCITFFSPEVSEALWVAVIFLIIMIGLYIGLMVWWHFNSAEWYEIIPFVILAVIWHWPLYEASVMTAANIRTEFWDSVFITVIPWLMPIVAVGFFIASALFMQSEVEETRSKNERFDPIERESHKRKSNLNFVLGWIFVGLTAIGAIVLIWLGCNWGALKPAETPAPEPTPTPTATPEPEPEDWVVWHNLELQDDDDPDNDYDFRAEPLYELDEAEGEDPMTLEEAVDYLVKKKHLKKSEAEEIMLDYVLEDLVAYWYEDPAGGAGTLADLDATTHNSYLSGQWFDPSDEYGYMQLINDQKLVFADDQDLYNETWDAAWTFMSKATIKLEYLTNATDQMYQNPDTPDGIPNVIICKSYDHVGYAVVFTFDQIKDEGTGKAAQMAIREKCGQPIDVARKLGTTPGANPYNPYTPYVPPSGGGDNGGGQQGAVVTNTTQLNSQTGKVQVNTWQLGQQQQTVKDVNAGTKVGPNDTTGPGPNTNNGIGAWYSSVQQPGGSVFMDYDEYWDAIYELEEANEISREAGDPNTPTYNPADDGYTSWTTDNNGDRGTVYGGIDLETPVSVPAQPVDGSAPTTGAGENGTGNADGAWGNGTPPT